MSDRIIQALRSDPSSEKVAEALCSNDENVARTAAWILSEGREADQPEMAGAIAQLYRRAHEGATRKVCAKALMKCIGHRQIGELVREGAHKDSCPKVRKEWVLVLKWALREPKGEIWEAINHLSTDGDKRVRKAAEEAIESFF